MRLYGHGVSGNVYKPQLLMAHLGIDYSMHHVSWEDGGTHAPEFLKLNPNAKVPALQDGDFVLWESGAILCYLAEGTSWFPNDRRLRAQVLQWMFFEQYSHEPFIATSRAIVHYEPASAERDDKIRRKRAGGEAALAVMEGHLAERDWFVGDTPTLADIALFAYTHVAEEGGFSLADYPSIRAWIERVEALPGHVDMESFEAATV